MASRFLLGLLMLTACVAHADSILGRPVIDIGSLVQAIPNCPTLEGQVCYQANTGKTSFFIPLSAASAGVFGVTNVGVGKTAGTFADVGEGTAGALIMFLLFAPVDVPAQEATLSFQFTDLDLIGVNDPAGFVETVQFFSDVGNALTPVITTNLQSSDSPLAYQVSGNSSMQTIFFPDVTSIVENPFYVKLVFGSDWYQRGTNTPEALTATLTTVPIPEPATFFLLGSAVAGLIARKRTRASRNLR